MKTFFYATLVLVFLAISGPVVYLYWRYRNTPVRVWYARLRTRRAELLAERGVLVRGPASPNTRLDALRERLFGEYLGTISVSALDRYPGIGVATVQKLRDYGILTALDLYGRNFQDLPGIGQKREQELRDARANLEREFQAVFDAGACPQGAQFRAEAAARQSAYQLECRQYSRQLDAVDVALAECARLDRLCGNLTFFNHLSGKASGIPPETLAAPLPVVRVPDVVPPPPVVPQPPSPSLTVAPALARNGPTPVVLPPRGRGQWVPAEPKDLFEDMLGKATATPSATTSGEPAGLATMKALARFGFLIAKGDGRIAQAERRTVREYLEHKFGGDPVLVRHLDVTMEEVEKAIPTEADAVAGVRAGVPEKEWVEVYAWAELISDASGERNTKELELLARVRAALGVTVKADTPLVAPAPKPVSDRTIGSEAGATKKESPAPSLTLPAPTVDPRTLLDIAADTPLSVELIRRRYALLSEKLDPAKAAAMGAEFAAMAADKRAKLKAAAEELLTPFGEPLEKPTAPPSSELRPNQDLDDAFGM